MAKNKNSEIIKEMLRIEETIPSIGDDGFVRWRKPGDYKLHRKYGPALESPDGRQIWYYNGLIHRTDGPAIIEPDGTKRWFFQGKETTEDYLQDYLRNEAMFQKD